MKANIGLGADVFEFTFVCKEGRLEGRIEEEARDADK